MFGIDDAVLAAGAGGFLGGVYQNHSAGIQAEWARDWQKMMSDTAHQREVRDLEAAGLNPLLSVNKGASSPAASAPPVGDPVQSGINSALALRANRADVALKEASVESQRMQNMLTAQDIEKRKEDTAGQVIQNSVGTLMLGKVPEEIDNLIASRGLTFQQSREVKQRVLNLMQEFGINQTSGRLLGFKENAAGLESDIAGSGAGRIGRFVERLGEILKPYK